MDGDGERAGQSEIYLGPLSAAVTFGASGILLEPPGRLVPPVPVEVVARNYARGEVDGPIHGQPEIVLALATTRSTGTLDTDGVNIKPLLARDLVYVLTWTDVPGVPSGPSLGGSERVQLCAEVSLVAADTGLFVLGFVGPNVYPEPLNGNHS